MGVKKTNFVFLEQQEGAMTMRILCNQLAQGPPSALFAHKWLGKERETTVSLRLAVGPIHRKCLCGDVVRRVVAWRLLHPTEAAFMTCVG